MVRLVFVLLFALACGDSDDTDAAVVPDSAVSDSGRDVVVNDAPGVDGTTMDVGGSDAPAVDAGSPSEIEGYGAGTTGAEGHPDGAEMCIVTTLDDDGAGSLRDCVSASGRHVTFSIGGVITLESDLNIPHSYVTVDGATAPSPGITIRQPGEIGTTIEARGSLGPAHDIIIRYVRMDGVAAGEHANVGDIWGLDGESNPVHHVVIDHVTGIASTDGVFDIWADVSDITISHSILMDTVTMLHLSGPDGTRRERITLHHNLFARNNERQIRLRHHSIDVEVVNNIVYGWGWFEAGAAGLHIAYDDGEQNPSLNVLANSFLFVGGLFGDEADALRFETGGDVGDVFFDGNVWPPGEMDVSSTRGDALPVPADNAVTRDDPADLSDQVTGWGTHFPSADERSLLESVAAIPTGR